MVVRQTIGGRQTGEFVLRRQPRHGQGAAGQGGQRVGGEIGRGDERHLLADEDAQAQIGAFAAFHIFQLAQAIGDAGGDILHQQGVGGIGAGFFGGIEQGGEKGLGVAAVMVFDAGKSPRRQAASTAQPLRRPQVLTEAAGSLPASVR